jgi:orotate phosphoribosyltransferase
VSDSRPGRALAIGSDRIALARDIEQIARITGTFQLRSGRIASDYFDKYRFESEPAIVDAVAQGMAALVPDGTEVLAGLELGGIPLVTLISHHTGLPAAFVRKEAKPYGTCRLAEGANVVGRRVLIVEDVVTSGGQVAISSKQLRELGAYVEQALCAIDREEGGREALDAVGVSLVALYTRSDLEQANASGL